MLGEGRWVAPSEQAKSEHKKGNEIARLWKSLNLWNLELEPHPTPAQKRLDVIDILWSHQPGRTSLESGESGESGDEMAQAPPGLPPPSALPEHHFVGS
ncbi:hypothetical protein RUM43_012541 [Polyplax serrata]|uniref:Uncharacterized protein n=1 Tax=Polyplax serrata TaxID=468196 RepID=A0AAN8NSF6_POLSC